MDIQMSEQNTIQIEDIIHECLNGDLKGRALTFSAYLGASDLTPQQWFGRNFWRVPHKFNYLCGIVVQKDRLRFWFWKGDYTGTHDVNFIKAVHDHVRPCISCGGECQGVDTVVFGNEFHNTCFQFPIQFENPSDETLEHIKKLMTYWKEVVPPDDAWHARSENNMN